MHPALEERSCPLCHCNEYEVIYRWPANFYSHEKYETCSWDGRLPVPLRIVGCRVCEFPYSRPSFREDFLSHVYPSDIVPATSSQPVSSPKAKHRSLLAKALQHFEKPNILIDVGTRYGGLPNLARKMGVEAYGIEVNSESVKRAHDWGRNFVLQGSMAQLGDLINSGQLPPPDIVTLDDVLEHLPYPKRDLDHLGKVLPFGCGLITRQMDWEALGHRLFGKNWYYLQPAAHMCYFDEEHLRNLFQQTGFKTLAIGKPNEVAVGFNTLVAILKKKGRGIIGQSPNWKAPTGKTFYLKKRQRTVNDMFIGIGVRGRPPASLSLK